jgi:starch phosphorylase
MMRDLLKVVFLPNYNVSLAEAVMPAADLSEQISTAGMEASGTGNMKLALNGAITIGTLDGANVEIRDHVGEDNIFIFGLRAEEVEHRWAQGWDPRAAIESSPELMQVLEALECGVFSPGDSDRHRSLVHSLRFGDHYMIAADFASYYETQRRIDELWRSPRDWARIAMTNAAKMAWFSSDRSIAEYAADIWRVPFDGGAV